MPAFTMTMSIVGTFRCSMVMGLIVAWLDEGVADMTRHRLAGAVIAAFLDPTPKAGDGGLLGVERDRRGLRDRVGVDFEHARAVAKDALDDRLLAGVLQLTDV